VSQKLREGVQPAATLVYAGFWIRFGARFIDGILLGVINIVIAFIMGIGLFRGSYTSHPAVSMQLLGNLIGMVIAMTYETWFLGRYGATLGKMACDLRVVRADGSPLTYGRGCGRYFATWLSGLTLCIGYIIAAFDSQKRALHDHVCGTRVIRKRN
jgi:uncharacterized RDD family membrane protein YckC